MEHFRCDTATALLNCITNALTRHVISIIRQSESGPIYNVQFSINTCIVYLYIEGKQILFKISLGDEVLEELLE